MADVGRGGRRILVTGATGFIGRRLVHRLSNGNEVLALCRDMGRVQCCDGPVRWIEHDLTLPLDSAALPSRLDAIIHLAQSRHYREFPDRADDIFGVNARGTFWVLEYARRAQVECFVLASSGGIYGFSNEKLVETAPVSPLNFYLGSKYIAEIMTGNYKRFFRTVVLRFFFVYGPGQRAMLVPSLLERVAAGDEITVEGNPGISINPIYIDDAVDVFEPALSLDSSDVLNVAGNEVVTITDLVRTMERVVGTRARIRYAAGTAHGDLIGDTTRMRRVLACEPRVSLSEGLERTRRALQS